MTDERIEAIEAMAQFLWRKYDPDPDDIGPLPFEFNADGWRRDARALWTLAQGVDMEPFQSECEHTEALAEVERLRARVNSDAEIMGEANLKMQALREALRAVRDTAHDDERVRIVDEALDA